MDSRDAAGFETSGIVTSFKLFSQRYPCGRRETLKTCYGQGRHQSVISRPGLRETFLSSYLSFVCHF